MRPTRTPCRALTDSELLVKYATLVTFLFMFVSWGAFMVLAVVFPAQGQAVRSWLGKSFIFAMVTPFGATLVLFFVAMYFNNRNWAIVQDHDCMLCPYCRRVLADAKIPGACPGCGERLHDREFVRKHWELIYDPQKHRPEWRNMGGP